MFRLNLSAQTHSVLNYLKWGCFTHLRYSVRIRPVYFFNMFDMCKHKHIIYKRKKKKKKKKKEYYEGQNNLYIPCTQASSLRDLPLTWSGKS